MKRQTNFDNLLEPIRARAYELGITEVASLTGLSRETIYRCVSARGNPRLDTIGRLLRALDMRCDFEVVSTPRRRKCK